MRGGGRVAAAKRPHSYWGPSDTEYRTSRCDGQRTWRPCITTTTSAPAPPPSWMRRRDPKERPTAKQALAHPWLQGKSAERTQGAPLQRTVVQRLQKFGVESALKRTVLDMIANDLINRHIEQLNMQQAAAAAQPGHPVQGQGQLPAAGAGAEAEAAGKGKDEAAAAAAGNSSHEPSRKGGTSPGGVAGADTGEATPAGAAAAAAAGAPVPPVAEGAAASAAALASKLRQFAAQDLLLRSASSGSSGALGKHAATVHAGGEALAVLRRGQLLGLPLAQRPGGVAGAAAPPANGAGAGAGAGPGSSMAAAAAAVQQTVTRRSHDQARPVLGRGNSGIHMGGAGLAPPSTALGQPLVASQAGPATPAGGSAARGSGQGQASSPFAVPTATWQRLGTLQSTGAAGSPALGTLGSGALTAAPGSAGVAPAGSYKGPVKDVPAATAWDLSFMVRTGHRGGGGC